MRAESIFCEISVSQRRENEANHEAPSPGWLVCRTRTGTWRTSGKLFWIPNSRPTIDIYVVVRRANGYNKGRYAFGDERCSACACADLLHIRIIHASYLPDAPGFHISSFFFKQEMNLYTFYKALFSPRTKLQLTFHCFIHTWRFTQGLL